MVKELFSIALTVIQKHWIKFNQICETEVNHSEP